MSYTDAQLTAVQTAIARGELEVEYNGRRVRYRTIDELLQAEKRILDSRRTTASPKQMIVIGCKGL